MDTDTIVRIGLIALVAIAVLTAMPGLRGTSSRRHATGTGTAPVRPGPHDTGTDHTPSDADHPVGHHTGHDGGWGGDAGSGGSS